MDAEKQTAQMVGFILAEARNKAEEIGAVATQSFAIEKQKILGELKAKVTKEYETKSKKLESQRAISRSTSVNKARLEKVAERAKFLVKVEDEVKTKLTAVAKNQGQYKDLVQKLVVQGCLKLLEAQVQVRCRQCDVALVESTLAAAASQYAQEVKRQAGVNKAVQLSVDKKTFLAPAPGAGTKSCLGGVVLTCHDGLITVDNTFDTRLTLCVDQDKPAIRAQLFPQ
jgi:V-type H+-transporting ATPase subunit E